MLTRLIFLFFAFSASFVAIAQLQGDALLRMCYPEKCFLPSPNLNMSIGPSFVIYDNNATQSRVQFLPGKYSSSIVEKLGMQTMLTSSTIIIPCPGYDLGSAIPPIDIKLQPGFVMYSNRFYSGQANFISVENSFLNQTIPLSGSSIAISENTWVALTADSGYPIILYDTAPFFNLPSTNQITIIDYQLTTCQPPCSGSGVCVDEKCVCHEGFAGSSCESCAPGLFGPACKVCPSPCKGCDKKTGLCSTPKAPKVKRAENTCKCENGRCKSDGNCSCLPGYTNATELNGVKCALCEKNYFMASAGDCKICELGCSKCEDGTGKCKSCQKGFILEHDPNDEPKCRPLPTVTKNSTCPSDSYSNGEICIPCTRVSESCDTCRGPSMSDCITCRSGYSKFENECVTVDLDGVCEGTHGMIANNDKNMCDTCGPKCTACKIPNFGPGSSMDQVQCTECLTGSAPSNGKCDTVSCSPGQFISLSSCEPCSPNCKTCIDTADNCLTCQTGQFLSDSVCTPCSSACKTCNGTANNCLTCSLRLTSGECVAACPHGTFNASHTCIPCHGDCATCYGPSFNQCTSCHQDRPVLQQGRCLRTCASKTQFFDSSTSSCLACDSSCSSCFASASSNCLACSDPYGVLNNDGTCSSLASGGYLGMSFNS